MNDVLKTLKYSFELCQKMIKNVEKIAQKLVVQDKRILNLFLDDNEETDSIIGV